MILAGHRLHFLVDRSKEVPVEFMSIYGELFKSITSDIVFTPGLPEGGKKKTDFEALWQRIITRSNPGDIYIVFGSAGKALMAPEIYGFFAYEVDLGEKIGTTLVVGLPSINYACPGFADKKAGQETAFAGDEIVSFVRNWLEAYPENITEKIEMRPGLSNLSRFPKKLSDLADVKAVTDKLSFRAFTKGLDFSKPIGIDFETTGLRFFKDIPKTFAISQPVDDTLSTFRSAVVELSPEINSEMKIFLEQIADAQGAVVGSNIAFDLKFYIWHYFRDRIGYILDRLERVRFLDTAAMFVAGDNSRVQLRGLKSLSSRLLGTTDYSLLLGADLAKMGTDDDLGLLYQEATSISADMRLYNALDTILPFFIINELQKNKETEKIDRLVMNQNNHFLLRVCLNGILFDWATLPDKRKALEEVATRHLKILTDNGLENPKSTKQISAVLRKYLGEAILKQVLGTTRSQKDIQVRLDGLKSLLERPDLPPDLIEILTALIDYKAEVKLLDGFLNEETLRKYADDQGFIHTNISIDRVSSGRTSSYDPNLQQIPGAKVMNRAKSMSQAYANAANVRALFIARPEWEMLELDLSQAEVRFGAFMGQDPALLDIYRNGRDIYLAFGSAALEKPEAMITKAERQIMKGTVLGLNYGMGPRRLAAQVGVTEIMSKHLYEVYFKTFPRMKFLASLADRRTSMHQDSYMVMAPTRQREIKELKGWPLIPFELYAQRIRPSIRNTYLNFPIQGPTSDLALSMGIYLDFTRRKRYPGFAVRNAVHDSILMEVPVGKGLAEGAALIKELSYFGPHIPGQKDVWKVIAERTLSYYSNDLDGILELPTLNVDAKVGQSWGEVEEVKSGSLIELRHQFGVPPQGYLRGMILTFDDLMADPISMTLEISDAEKTTEEDYVFVIDSRFFIPKGLFEVLRRKAEALKEGVLCLTREASERKCHIIPLSEAKGIQGFPEALK